MSDFSLPAKTEFLLYQSEDGRIRVETRMENETVWLSLNQMAELFGVDKSGISRHLKKVFESGELARDSVVAILATTQIEGGRQVIRDMECYNLDAVMGRRLTKVLKVHNPLT